jgi:NADH-quinone oxidoreductase subunit J
MMFAADLLVAQNIAFYGIAAIIIVAAIRVVTVKNLVHAALWLVVVLAGIAGQFILLAAEFIAITQVLVYIGAVIVLFLFGIMLTRAPMGQSEELDSSPTARIVGVCIAVVLLFVLGVSVWDGFGDQEFGDIAVQDTRQVANEIIGTYVVPLQLVAVLLLATLVGAVVLARRD